WSRGSKKLLQIKDGTVKYYVNKAQCRCKVFPNGTLLIQHVVKEDSGRYTVTVYERNGILRAEENTQFTVQGKRNHLIRACPFSPFSELVPQPVLSGECRNKTLSVKCEVKQ
ncbi:CD2 protein, partial [Rhynochetos jubatus]|nr:CD2 protein [Rhynochetos jubatus]